jgi:hypothetical protein
MTSKKRPTGSKATRHSKAKIKDLSNSSQELSEAQAKAVKGGQGAFEIKDFSFGVENPTTIGSATSGAGAGKAKFNEFEITKTP